MNFMSLEHWTDGHTVGSLMPPSESMRFCDSCDSIFNIRDVVDIDELSSDEMYELIEEPVPAPRTIFQRALRAIAGDPPPETRRVIRPDLPRHIQYLPGEMTQLYLDRLLTLPSESKHHSLFETELRLRLWRRANDWYRPSLLIARESGSKRPPEWSVSATQVEHLERLLKLITDPKSKRGDELLHVELLRQLRRFEEAERVLDSAPDSRWNDYQRMLISNNMPHVGLYP